MTQPNDPRTTDSGERTRVIGDASADATRRVDRGDDPTRLVGTNPMPRPPEPVVSEERPPFQDEDLERRLRNSRIAIGALVAVVLVLLLALAAIGLGMLGSAQEESSVESTPVEAPVEDDDGAAGHDGAADGPDAADGSVAGSDDEGTGSPADRDGDVQADGAEDDRDVDGAAPGESVAAADLVEIVGEKWSNAQRILEAYGVDMDSLVLITDDGGQVIDASNWTVTLVADLDDSGKVAVHLQHDSENWWDVLGGAAESVLP